MYHKSLILIFSHECPLQFFNRALINRQSNKIIKCAIFFLLFLYLTHSLRSLLKSIKSIIWCNYDSSWVVAVTFLYYFSLSTLFCTPIIIIIQLISFITKSYWVREWERERVWGRSEKEFKKETRQKNIVQMPLIIRDSIKECQDGLLNIYRREIIKK